MSLSEFYNINVETLENGEIVLQKKSKVGSDVNLEIIPDKGFKLKDIIVKDEKNNIIKVNNNGEKYSFVMPARDVTVNAAFEKETYIFTSDDNQKYIKEGSSKELTFTCTGDLDLLTDVYINNEELSSKNYTLESGSTVITLKNEYLESLDNGEYELKLKYSNGEEVATNFVVSNRVEENNKEETPIKENKEETPIKENKEETPIKENKEEQVNENILDNTPKTGDTIIIICISIIIVLVLGNLMIIIKKKKGVAKH